MTKKKKKTIRAKHWKRSTSIPEEKYDAVSKAILRSLGSKEMRWGELVDLVHSRLPDFEGSIWWYTTVCLRELERQGKIVRKLGRPVLYSKKK